MRVRIETEQGLIDRELMLAEGEITMADLARAAVTLAGDFETLAVRRTCAQGRPATCAKGCGACCRQLVTVSPAEAWMLEELIEAMPGAERADMRGRFEAARAALAREGLLEALGRLDDPELRAEAHYQLAERYFELGLACPFLTEAGACGIHPARPALCREYLAVTPPFHCYDPFGMEPERAAVAAEVSQALLGACAQTLRRELEPIPLALAPAWAREHAEEGRRRWDAQRLAERFLLHLEVSIGQLAEHPD